jgi:hypothetical protein
MDCKEVEVGQAAMKGLAYGALAGIVAGVVCFGAGFLVVTAIGVPEGSSFGVGIEPWNIPGTLLGAAVWFHLLALTRTRGIPTAIVSMIAYNGVRLVAWGFGLEMLWSLVHARFSLATCYSRRPGHFLYLGLTPIKPEQRFALPNAQPSPPMCHTVRDSAARSVLGRVSR